MDPVPLSTSTLSFAISGKVAGLSAAIILLIVISAFFSAAEIAYACCNRIRLKNIEASGVKRARRVLKQLENYNKILNTAVIGNNLVNILATTLSTILFNEFFENTFVSALISILVQMVLIMLFAEIMPKGLAKENAEKFAMFSAPALGFFMILLAPLVWLFNLWRKLYKSKNLAAVTEDELITIVEEAENDGEINEHESELIRSAIEFDDVELYDIMVPRVHMVAIKDDYDLSKIADIYAESGFSRLPVYKESIDSIVGVLHEKDFYTLLRDNKNDIISKLKGSICLPGNMKISDALRRLQKEKVHMAIVVDEFGGTSGLVTLEDIIEELVGEIYDEHDEEEVLQKRIDDTTFVVSGAQNVEDMFDEMDIELSEEFDSSTVGGWVTEELKRIPASGETFTYRNLYITVTKASPRKVIEIKVQILPKDPDVDDE